MSKTLIVIRAWLTVIRNIGGGSVERLSYPCLFKLFLESLFRLSKFCFRVQLNELSQKSSIFPFAVFLFSSCRPLLVHLLCSTLAFCSVLKLSHVAILLRLKAPWGQKLFLSYFCMSPLHIGSSQCHGWLSINVGWINEAVRNAYFGWWKMPKMSILPELLDDCPFKLLNY